MGSFPNRENPSLSAKQCGSGALITQMVCTQWQGGGLGEWNSFWGDMQYFRINATTRVCHA